MRRVRTRTWVVIILAVLAVAAIALAVVPDRLMEDRVERAVRNYDDAVTRALEGLDPEEVTAFSSTEQRMKVAAQITYLWGNGLYMEAQLLSLEVLEIEEQADGGISVLVLEEWRYQERDRQTDDTVGGGQREEQVVRYELIPGGGRFIVDDLEVVETR